MKLASVLGIMIVMIIMTLYEWPKMNKNQKKEKWTFVTLTIVWGLITILLVFFPDMPGPTYLIDWLFKPLGKLLEP